MKYLLVALIFAWVEHVTNCIKDPIAGIAPAQGSPWPGHHRGHPVQEAATNKRDANIIDASSIREEVARTEFQGSSEDTGHCTYTFVVPGGGQHCRGRSSSSLESEKHVINLHREVLNTKAQIDETRREIEIEKQALPSAREIESLQENVDLLQRESRNMDSRVSQLYMQLLHEIINKRDNSLEMQQLEAKLLNQTVKYHALKEANEQLKQEQNALRLQIENQSQEFQHLRRQIQGLIKHEATLQVHGRQETRPTTSTTRTSTRMLQINSQAEETKTRKRSNVHRTVISQSQSGSFGDCVQIQRSGHRRSGIFSLRIPGYNKNIRVWCDFEQDPGGWIVIQRRTGRNVNFNRNFAAYKRGFGKIRSDFWLGKSRVVLASYFRFYDNLIASFISDQILTIEYKKFSLTRLEKIHRLTNQTGINFKLHIDMEDWAGRKTFVEYQSFRVGGEETGYRLNINHYSGTAGDSLTLHNNMRFTTPDHDEDLFKFNCARIHGGGWWYNSCAHSNLNGLYYRGGHYRNRYQNGIYWSEWRGGSYSLKTVSMKIRPTE